MIPAIRWRRPTIYTARWAGATQRFRNLIHVPDQRKALVATGAEAFAHRAMLESHGDPAMASPLGVLTNGGVWPSINGTLIWALALEDSAPAWDEWKKNSFAMHANAYPEIWYGIWSGPPTITTRFVKISRPDHVRGTSISRSQNANRPGI